MMINHNNIEEYLLDYLEGNLNPVLTAELMAFLAENPEYEELIRDSRRYTISPVGDRFPDTYSLKRNYTDIAEINSNNFDEFCIAASEGILGPSDIKRLNRYIGEDARKIKNLKLFSALKLKPDIGITFPDKAKLKKTKGLHLPRRYFYYSLAVAASVAFVFLLTLNSPKNSLNERETLVLTDNTTPEQREKVKSNMNTEPSPAVASSSSHSQSTEKKAPEIPLDKVIEADIRPLKDNAENLAELEPIVARVTSKVKDNALGIEVLQSEQDVHKVTPERQLHMESENLFAGLLKKINFWKTAETALSGFNYLTEANVSINKTTDDQGRLTQLTLNTESYSIEGKLR